MLSAIKTTAAKAQIPDQQRPLADVIARIEKLNDGLREFWSASHGWAPDDAAELMTKSRLDRQVSLSRSLRHWLADPADTLEDGDLILGWANLGSLIEGTIKLFLAVYYQDYKKDLPTLKQTQAWHAKQAKLLDPDGLRLNVLISYVEKASLFQPDEIALFKQAIGEAAPAGPPYLVLSPGAQRVGDGAPLPPLAACPAGVAVRATTGPVLLLALA